MNIQEISTEWTPQERLDYLSNLAVQMRARDKQSNLALWQLTRELVLYVSVMSPEFLELNREMIMKGLEE